MLQLLHNTRALDIGPVSRRALGVGLSGDSADGRTSTNASFTACYHGRRCSRSDIVGTTTQTAIAGISFAGPALLPQRQGRRRRQRQQQQVVGHHGCAVPRAPSAAAAHNTCSSSSVRNGGRHALDSPFIPHSAVRSGGGSDGLASARLLLRGRPLATPSFGALTHAHGHAPHCACAARRVDHDGPQEGGFARRDGCGSSGVPREASGMAENSSREPDSHCQVPLSSGHSFDDGGSKLASSSGGRDCSGGSNAQQPLEACERGQKKQRCQQQQQNQKHQPRTSRRDLLGLGLAAAGVAAASELGIVDAARAALAEGGKKGGGGGAWLLGDVGVELPSFPGGPGGERGRDATRVYDASVLGEPVALSDKARVWQRLLGARVVYLGEAEGVHDPTDKVLELSIIQRVRDECFAQGRPVTVAFSAFPRPLQPDLNDFFARKLSEEDLRRKVGFLARGRWEETLPILRYCRDNGVRLFACGVPPEVLRTVQAQGISGLSISDRKKYAPSFSPATSATSLLSSASSSPPLTPSATSTSPPSAATSTGSSPSSPSSSSSSIITAEGFASLQSNGSSSGVGGGLGGAAGLVAEGMVGGVMGPVLGAVAGAGLGLLNAGPANAEGMGGVSPPRASLPFGPGPYRFAQARAVEAHAVAQAVGQAMADGGAVGMLIVITGASQVRYGARGSGVPARVANKLKKSKQTQLVVLLNPERQQSRTEGSLPEADYLWYSGARACTRNCFDRAEVARVMGAAGRRREALPQDLQMGIERGLISPQTLQSFLELESQPWIAEATKRFQGLRERFYADPRFLQRLCIEESISITTSLLAQYQKRGKRFWSELEYVATDIFRGAVVDFFTVWLPAPTLSFDSRALDNPLPGSNGSKGGIGAGLGGLQGWLSSLPENAFQRAGPGKEWGLAERVGAVVLGGAKLFSVGFVSSIGTVGVTNGLMAARQALVPGGGLEEKDPVKRSPVVKTALVYASFLGTSANLRYQMIAGVVEHWVADYFLASQPLAGAVLSFVARTANSYWGTGQWVDLARHFGLQAHEHEESQPQYEPPASLPPPPTAPAATLTASQVPLSPPAAATTTTPHAIAAAVDSLDAVALQGAESETCTAATQCLSREPVAAPGAAARVESLSATSSSLEDALSGMVASAVVDGVESALTAVAGPAAAASFVSAADVSETDHQHQQRQQQQQHHQQQQQQQQHQQHQQQQQQQMPLGRMSFVGAAAAGAMMADVVGGSIDMRPPPPSVRNSSGEQQQEASLVLTGDAAAAFPMPQVAAAAAAVAAVSAAATAVFSSSDAVSSVDTGLALPPPSLSLSSEEEVREEQHELSASASVLATVPILSEESGLSR